MNELPWITLSELMLLVSQLPPASAETYLNKFWLNRVTPSIESTDGVRFESLEFTTGICQLTGKFTWVLVTPVQVNG